MVLAQLWKPRTAKAALPGHSWRAPIVLEALVLLGFPLRSWESVALTHWKAVGSPCVTSHAVSLLLAQTSSVFHSTNMCSDHKFGDLEAVSPQNREEGDKEMSPPLHPEALLVGRAGCAQL